MSRDHNALPQPTSRWEILPKGWSRHYLLHREDGVVVTLQMGSFWTLAECEFTIADQTYAVHRTAAWRDKIQFVAGEQKDVIGEANRALLSSNFELFVEGRTWKLQNIGWLRTSYQLLTNDLTVGMVRIRWFGLHRFAEFADTYVPPPVQVLVLFLALRSIGRSD